MKPPLLKIVLLFLTILFLAIGTLWLVYQYSPHPPSDSEQEPGFESTLLEDALEEPFIHPRIKGLENWKRPQGPLKVALQAGHWKAAEAPDELENLRVSTGTSFGKITEWETVLSIAEEAKKILEARGVEVEILPTTIPPNYWADVFVSIHTDGNLNSSISGYKVAAPRRDQSGKAEDLARLITEEYGKATNLSVDPEITRTMRGYYAFNWRRYDHSVHPLTASAIVETGFLTNANDRQILVGQPEKSALGIATGILRFLNIPLTTP